jgi:flavin reductase (DIM6/NTAB) family NADH-FMN oxidoreductase RutF
MNYIDTQDLDKYAIKAQDGEIGNILDFYFDEDLFYLRYFVVNTEPFLLRNLVLVSPISFHKIDSKKKTVEMLLTKKEIEESPTLESVEVISRQYEKAYHDHFSWPYYWGPGTSAWGIGPHGILGGYYERVRKNAHNLETKDEIIKEAKENNLRSSKEICTYSVSGSDNEFGHIQGFILNSITLSIDFIIIDTINYLPSKNVLLRPEWIENISWASKTVTFPFSQELIKSAPAYKKGEINNAIIKKCDEHFLGELNETTTKIKTNKNLTPYSIKNRRNGLKKFSEKESVVGHIPSGLFLVTVQNDETKEAEGFLASWVQQASFDPLLISLCIKDGRPGIETILKKSSFCINVVGQENSGYLSYFTNQGESSGNPLDRIAHEKVAGMGAIINDAKSVMVCKAHEVSHPGDHYLVTAEVTNGYILNSQLDSKTYLRDEGSHY